MAIESVFLNCPYTTTYIVHSFILANAGIEPATQKASEPTGPSFKLVSNVLR